MFTGTTDVLTFQANIPGVRLSIDGQNQGELPLTIDMSRNFVGGKQFLARFEKPGYQTQQFQLAREFNTVAILDVSSTLISGGVDVMTGAIMRFAPKQYHVEMVAEGADGRPQWELVRFALVNFDRLKTESARGHGEALDTLAALGGDVREVAPARDARSLARAITAGQPGPRSVPLNRTTAR